MNIGQAVEAPRIHHQWLPNIKTFEKPGISPDTEHLYKMRGHKVRYRGSQGSAMGIFVDYKKGLIYGASDSRAFDGKAVGQ
jgi:gamma-glutamyltranspeptidase/glutathione hydrolase